MCSSRPSDDNLSNLGLTPTNKDTLLAQQQRLAYLTATNPRHGSAQGGPGEMERLTEREEARKAELNVLRLRALADAGE